MPEVVINLRRDFPMLKEMEKIRINKFNFLFFI